MTTKIKLPVTLMRGGTSKGAYLLRKDMPPERKDWDSVLLKLMGSPDRQTDRRTWRFPVRNQQGRYYRKIQSL